MCKELEDTVTLHVRSSSTTIQYKKAMTLWNGYFAISPTNNCEHVWKHGNMFGKYDLVLLAETLNIP